jgi:hypothetical protein
MKGNQNCLEFFIRDQESNKDPPSMYEEYIHN